tara:strand:- start:5584 stop:6048 length:465 start_codon:yes stop_codon:yes gene_type:complete
MTDETKKTETTSEDKPNKEIQPGDELVSSAEKHKEEMAAAAQKDDEQKAMDEKIASMRTQPVPDEEQTKVESTGPFDDLPEYEPVGKVNAIAIADVNPRLGSIQFANGRSVQLGNNWITKFDARVGNMLVVDQKGEISCMPEKDFNKLYAVIDE